MAQRDDQRARERLERDAERRIKDEGKAAGPIGRKIVRENIQLLIDFIDANRGATRPTERTFIQKSLLPNVWDRIAGVPSDVLAGACLAGVLNYVRPPLRDDEDESVGRSMSLIGREIERQVEFWKLKDKEPKRGEMLERTTTRIRKRGARWKHVKPFLATWLPKDRREAGNWAYDSCLQALPHIFEEGKFGPRIKETATEADLRDVYVKPFYSPSPRKSQPWTEFNNADREPFLRHTRLSVADLEAVMLSGQMQPHMDAISYLQATPCAVNTPVFNFARSGSLVELHRPADYRSFDADMAEAAQVRGQAFYTDMNGDHRGRVNPLPYFHFGRGDHIRSLIRFAYGAPITKRGIWWLKAATANCYNENGMSRRPFEERVAWTERNLDRIRQIAADPWSGVRLYGEGRCVVDGEEVKTRDGVVVERPPWLKAAKDPHQFLAHAIELVAALKEGPSFITTLPIAFDASNSGAQQYALLMRDRRLAELTNLIDAETPQDLYSEFGGHITRHFSTRKAEIGLGDDIDVGDRRERDRIRWCELQELDERSAQKGFAVAWIYGSGKNGQLRTLTRQIRKNILVPEFGAGRVVEGALPSEETFGPGEPTRTRKVVYKRLPRDEVPKGTLQWFIELQREAMEKTAPGIRDAMNFIRSLPMPLQWTSPSGVPVLNLERKIVVSKLQLWRGPGPQPKLSRNRGAVGYELEMDEGETRLAAAPNFIHSMDAAHLAFVALACERENIPLLTVHDSFACLPCHADRLRKILLHELRKMYRDRDWLAELGPNRPPLGDLQIEEVRGRYAFS